MVENAVIRRSVALRPHARPRAGGAWTVPAAAYTRGQMTTRIGINGFGRIGRSVLRIAQGRDDVEIVGINDLADPHNLGYLLEFDSVHRRFKSSVRAEDGALVVDERRIPFTQIRNPAQVPWGQY